MNSQGSGVRESIEKIQQNTLKIRHLERNRYLDDFFCFYPILPNFKRRWAKRGSVAF